MTITRLLASTATAALLFGAATAQAADGPFTLSGTAAVTSDYVFRGVSQTDEKAALQAGLTVSHESGLWAGAWASNVDDDFIPGADVELDLSAGYSNSVGDFSYTAGVYWYTYPGQDDGADVNYVELGFTGSYTLDKFAFTGQVYWSPEFTGPAGGDAYYGNIGASYALTDAFKIYYAAGKSWIQEGTNYVDWNIGAAFTYNAFTFDVKYTDTDLDDSDIADSRIVGTVTFAF
ncbi:TorF family putative porin [Oleisolibacter albus]|uniref:TorF family putative porin n=1 Tax=Oleisolibacter albus TaxID=2171757 RepID=UPI000DF364B9|nr:TorF family putative porin [Oleisolibacter albus]